MKALITNISLTLLTAILAMTPFVLHPNEVNAQGNRLLFNSIRHTQGKCLDFNGESVVVAACDGSREQMWAFDGYGQLVHAYGWCLGIVGGHYNGAPITLQSCDGSNHQYWQRSGLAFRSIVGYCLDAPQYQVDNSRLHAWECHGAVWQQWHFGNSAAYGHGSSRQVHRTEDNCSGTLYLQRARGMPLIELPKRKGVSASFPIGSVQRGSENIIEWGCKTKNVSNDRTRCPSTANFVYIKRNSGREFVTRCYSTIQTYY